MAGFKTKKEKLMMDGPENLNRLVLGAEIKGDLATQTSIRLDGTVEGSVQCAAKLVLGQTGSINGTVHSREADIEGLIKGDIVVAELLVLRSTAQIDGNISAHKLVIEDGAEFNGNCTMNKGTTETNVDREVNKRIMEEEVVY
jgi:cytoskeletal protein CcmA (bactofilin family)